MFDVLSAYSNVQMSAIRISRTSLPRVHCNPCEQGCGCERDYTAPASSGSYESGSGG